jgi:hypothetical protein
MDSTTPSPSPFSGRRWWFAYAAFWLGTGRSSRWPKLW